jgi:anaerobic ribonucleoside-triphosphate reductase activating protein
MKIALSRIHFPVRTLGPGARTGIWFQGCSIRCPGCVSMDTWVEDQHVTTLDEVKEALLPSLSQSDGVTISGGEPFDQPEALHALLQWLRDVHSGDLFVYSGYTYEALQQHLAAFHGLIDALMTDPFRQDIGQTLALRGSDNQRLFFFTELGRQRFTTFERQRGEVDRALDIMFDDYTGEIFLAGIPARDDLNRLAGQMKAEGHRLIVTADKRTAS